VAVPVGGHGEEHRLVQQWCRIQRRVGLDRHNVVVVQERHVEPAVAQRGGHGDRVQLGP
jgi:hypothetical protein